jgi:hypothetical protein
MEVFAYLSPSGMIFKKQVLLLGYEAGHLLRGQRTLETKEVTRRGLFLAS